MSLSSDRLGPNALWARSPIPFFPSPLGSSNLKEETSLRDAIRVLRKRRNLVLLWALGCFALACLYCAVAHNTYTSTATLLVDRQNSSGLGAGMVEELASSMGGEDALKTDLSTHSTVLESDTTTLRVIHRLDLDKVYAYKPGLFGWDRQIKSELGLPLEKATATRERLLSLVQRRLKVEPGQDTRLITVRYTDRDPQRTADVANAFVEEYIHEYLESHFNATARASNWLSGQLDNLKSRVADSQQKLSDYESKTGLSVLMLGMGESPGSTAMGGGAGVLSSGGGGHIPAVDKLAVLNGELTAAEADRITKEAIYQLTQTQSPEVVSGLGSSPLASAAASGAVVNEGQGFAVLQGLRAQEASIRVQYGDLASKYGANNPHLAELQGQIDAIDKAIAEELKRINQRARNDVELARRTEDGLRKAYNDQQSQVNKLNDDAIQLEVLAGEALSNRELYDQLFTRLQEAQIQAGVSATNLDLVDEARPTSVPTNPNWRLYPPLGLGAGLLLGVGFAFMRENLDDSLVTTEQVQLIGLLPVLADIPLIRAEVSRGRAGDGPAPGTIPGTPADLIPGTHSDTIPEIDPLEQSLLLTRPNAPAAEAYRALRTAIQLSAAENPLRVLLVTSPLGGDGKTTISYNLAVAFAQHGRKVLLLDSDMRKPSAHALFRASKADGLSEVLTGGIPLSRAIRSHDYLKSLYLLPSGATPPNPAELIDSRRFDALLEEARSQFDLVLIDSRPVLMATDPVILSTKTDGTLVVLRSRKTTRPVLKRAVEVLSPSPGRKLGFVINGMDTKSVEYYYSYGYYGDNKYYGEEA
jgi:capsular exopolysaccharide synthesis family protein